MKWDWTELHNSEIMIIITILMTIIIILFIANCELKVQTTCVFASVPVYCVYSTVLFSYPNNLIYSWGVFGRRTLRAIFETGLKESALFIKLLLICFTVGCFKITFLLKRLFGVLLMKINSSKGFMNRSHSL